MHTTVIATYIHTYPKTTYIIIMMYVSMYIDTNIYCISRNIDSVFNLAIAQRSPN